MVIVPVSLVPPIERAIPLTFNACMSLSDLIERQDMHFDCANNAYGLTVPVRHYIQIANLGQSLIAAFK